MSIVQRIIFLGAFSFAVVSASEYEGGDFLTEHEGYGGSHEFDYGHGGEEFLQSHYPQESLEHYPEEHHYDSKDEHPQYHYEYSVHDPHTDDYKTHQESRDGDKVSGHYTVKEADGTLREVHYTADDKHGFQAVVTKGGKQIYPYVEDNHPGHF